MASGGPRRYAPPVERDDRHELAEARSLALHRVVAERLKGDPAVLDRAKQRIDEWLRLGQPHPEYALAWRDLLTGPLDALLAVLTDGSERARSLRQVTPFAGVVSPRERWALWRETRP